MLTPRLIPFAAVALLSLAYTPLRAQGSKQVELAFGYECGDRFLVRNDGSQPVVLEYAVAGSRDKSQLHLNARQSVEIASAQDGNLELWVAGKVVASEPKGNRTCKGTPQTNGDVSVRPLDTNDNDMAAAPQAVEPGYSSPPVVVYSAPDSYYPYPYYPYSYYGWGYPSISFYGRIGGFGHGYGYGRGIGSVGRGRPGGRGRR